MKRKFEDAEEPTALVQRQSILDISMFKLHSSPVKRVEPPLLRSVLILNTLKHIEVELQKDGVQSNLPDSSSFSFDDNSDINMDALPDVNGSNFETHHSDVSLLHAHKVVSNPLPPIESFVELSNSSVSQTSMKQITEDSGKTEKNEGQGFLSNHHFHPLSPAKVEDMLADIDFSSTDFDIFSTLATSMKLTPLSAEEVLHSFPAHSNVITESYASLFNSPVNSTSCKGEVLPEELENIMQILVGT